MCILRTSEVSKTSTGLKTLYVAPPCISKLIEGIFSSSVLQTETIHIRSMKQKKNRVLFSCTARILLLQAKITDTYVVKQTIANQYYLILSTFTWELTNQKTGFVIILNVFPLTWINWEKEDEVNNWIRSCLSLRDDDKLCNPNCLYKYVFPFFNCFTKLKNIKKKVNNQFFTKLYGLYIRNV